jgi:glycosyltransferase involved in cell wall biosynthesis
VLFIESKLLRTGPAGYLQSWLMDSQERDLFRRARHVILISPYLEKIYGPLLRGRVHFVENPIEESFFHLERDPDPHRLLFVGAVVPRKRVHLLAEALARVGEKVPGAHLRVVGPLASRESERSLRDVIARHGLEERVHVTGPVSEEQIVEEYRRAGVLLLSSREETAPLVIAQAMASGLPVVSVAAGGVPFMVRHEESALLARKPTAEDLAREILRLFEEPDLARRLAEEGRRQARERFLDRAVAERTLAVYRSILDEGPRHQDREGN